MIKIKDISVLKDYGFELDNVRSFLKVYGIEPDIDENLERLWEYDCGDNRTYIFIYEDDKIIRIGTPYGDVPAQQLTYQLDIIFKLIKDGHCELKEE